MSESSARKGAHPNPSIPTEVEGMAGLWSAVLGMLAVILAAICAVFS